MSKKQIIFSLALVVLLVIVLFDFSGPKDPSIDDDIKNISVKIAGLAKNDPSEAINYLNETYKNNAQVQTSCHSLAHEIGRGAYHKYASGEPLEFGADYTLCGFGFYHGFLESLFQDDQTGISARDFCYSLDASSPKLKRELIMQCFHGIGHGVATVHDKKSYSRMDKKVNQSLLLCQRISKNEDESLNCASGVFNAVALEISTGLYVDYLRENNLFAICQKQERIYKEACYGNLNTLILWQTNNNLSEALKLIEEEVEDDFVDTAIRYSSAYHTSTFALEDESKQKEIVFLCRDKSPRYATACVLGVAQGLMEFGIPQEEYLVATNFCTGNHLTQTEKGACLELVFNYMNSIYSKAKMETVCSNMPAYNEFCLKL